MSDFRQLSKMSLQDALLNRLSQLANARKLDRQLKSETADLKADIHEIYCAIHELESDKVIPFRRTEDYLTPPTAIKRRA